MSIDVRSPSPASVHSVIDLCTPSPELVPYQSFSPGEVHDMDAWAAEMDEAEERQGSPSPSPEPEAVALPPAAVMEARADSDDEPLQSLFAHDDKPSPHLSTEEYDSLCENLFSPITPPPFELPQLAEPDRDANDEQSETASEAELAQEFDAMRAEGASDPWLAEQSPEWLAEQGITLAAPRANDSAAASETELPAAPAMEAHSPLASPPVSAPVARMDKAARRAARQQRRKQRHGARIRRRLSAAVAYMESLALKGGSNLIFKPMKGGGRRSARDNVSSRAFDASGTAKHVSMYVREDKAGSAWKLCGPAVCTCGRKRCEHPKYWTEDEIEVHNNSFVHKDAEAPFLNWEHMPALSCMRQ